uniref:Phosphatidylinositol transfer protein N-terminal domain-containing protein n=1 Tax=Vombatus ursinus TaxID=29139 RepID=A0A4X2KGC4_VOMUR
MIVRDNHGCKEKGSPPPAFPHAPHSVSLLLFAVGCYCPAPWRSIKWDSCIPWPRPARITRGAVRASRSSSISPTRGVLVSGANLPTRSTICRARFQDLFACSPLRVPWCFMRRPGMPTRTAALSIQNEYMKDDFFIKIETWHHPDMGTQDNVHHLDAETWKEVEVVPIDIADRTQVSDEDYKPEEDPALFRSVKTGRGPLGPNWQRELLKHPPHMCAYKLVTVKFRWWGLQGRVESFIHKQEKRLFTNFHRQLFCWLDQWVDLSMEDIRNLEEETQRELDQMRKTGPVRGMRASDD